MPYIEKKLRIRKKYAFLGVATLVVLCFFNIANSKGSAAFAERAVLDQKRSVPARISSPVKVAIIDSNFNGVDMDGFSGNLETYDIVSGSTDGVTENIVTQQGNILEENNNHGTRVMEEFMDEYRSLHGVYDPNVLLVKISAGNDIDGKVNSDYVAKGIMYAVKNNAKIINISLGTLQKTSNVLEAIGYARTHGAVVVAASGNWGDDKKIAKYAMSTYAQSKGVIAVGSMDDNGEISSFTSGVGNSNLEFLAKTKFGSGTSLAAPVVSADVASIWEQNLSSQHDGNMNSRLDLEEIKNALTRGAGDKYVSIKGLGISS